MNLYSVGIAAAVLMCTAAFILLSRPHTPLGNALLIGGCGAMGGLIVARLIYWLGALDFFIGRTHSMLSFFWWTDGGFSLFGAVAGTAGAAWAVSRLLRERPETLDALAFPLLLLAAEGRLLEWSAMGMDFGAACENPVWLTVPGEYGRHLNVALIEALMMVGIAAFLMIRMKQSGNRVSLRDALFLLGLTEAMMISMRRDSFMMWGFVHQEQLYFYLMSAVMAILSGFEAKKPAAGIIASLLAAGAITFLEFALDGRVAVPFAFMRDWADIFWYALFALCLTAFSLYYFYLRQMPERKRPT